MKKFLLSVAFLLLLTLNSFAEKDLCTQVISTAEPIGRFEFTYNAFDADAKSYIGALVIRYSLKDSNGVTLKQDVTTHRISETSKALTLDQIISAIKAQLGNICSYVAEDKLSLAGETYQCN